MLNLITSNTSVKTYTVAGIAVKNGVPHVRFTNSVQRAAALRRDGQTDVRLAALPHACTEIEAVKLLAASDLFSDDLAQQAIANYYNNNGNTRTTNTQNVSANGDKLFTVAGVSRKGGILQLRVANDTARGKALQKDGQTDIRLVSLPHAMTKLEAADWLAEHDDFQDDEAQATIDTFKNSTSNSLLTL